MGLSLKRDKSISFLINQASEYCAKKALQKWRITDSGKKEYF
jgi:hypothetical protein